MTATRKSISGVPVTLGKNAIISWKSSQQTCVALSTAETEFVAQSESVKELLWLCEVMRSICLSQKEATEVCQDNQAAISWGEEGTVSKKTKHVAVRYHFTKQQVQEGRIALKFVPSEEIKVDFFD